MPAARYTMVIEQGATFELPITWFADEKRTKPVNLSNYTARLQIRPSAESPVVLYDSVAGNQSKIVAWFQCNADNSLATAGVADNIFNRFEDWCKIGWVVPPNSPNQWSIDRLLDHGVENIVMGWLWGMLDAGYIIGPYDPAWDPGSNGLPNPSHPQWTGCSPITEEQHRLLVGSSFINQVRASLGLNTVRRSRIKKLWFYQGCCPYSETTPATNLPGYDKYLASAIACGANVAFDAEPLILYAGATAVPGFGGVDPGPFVDPGVDPAGDAPFVIPPHRLLRQRMRDLNIPASMEPMPQRNVSGPQWMNGTTEIMSLFGYIANAYNRPNLHYWPYAQRALGKQHMELLWNFDPGFGLTQNIESQIQRTKQLITDGYMAAMIFGLGGGPEHGLMSDNQLADLLAFDKQNAENGHITLGGESGTITIKIPSGITKAFSPTGTAVYDLLLTSPSGEVTRLVEGPCEVRPDVTENA